MRAIIIFTNNSNMVYCTFFRVKKRLPPPGALVPGAPPPSGYKKSRPPGTGKAEKHGQAVGKTRREKGGKRPLARNVPSRSRVRLFSGKKHGPIPPLTAGKRPGTFRRASRPGEQPGLASGTRPAGKRCPEQTEKRPPFPDMRAVPGSAKGALTQKSRRLTSAAPAC